MVVCVVTIAVIALVCTCIRITNFHLHIGLLLVNQWKGQQGKTKKWSTKLLEYLRIQPYSKNIINYNNIQDSLKKLAGMDDFLTG